MEVKWWNNTERACVTFPLFVFGQGTTFFFLMVICNSLNLLLKSLPINIINCIKFYVNCSALTGAYDWQYKYLFVSGKDGVLGN
jgi:hypothetical protein